MANNSNNIGAFIPSSYIFDVSSLYDIDVTSPAFKELLVRLYQNVNNIALLLNRKDTGYYPTLPFVCGQAYFPNPLLTSNSPTTPVTRQVYREVVVFAALPASATTVSMPHNLPVNASYTWTRIYGTATNNASLLGKPIPYVDATGTAANNIAVDVTATNVVITGGGTDYSAWSAFVVIEWITS